MTSLAIFQQRLAEWRPAAGRQELHSPIAGLGWSVALTADRHDEVGSLVWELSLRRTGPAESAVASLSAWATRVAERVTGLMEPLKVVEVDVERSEALLRSNEPAERDDHLFYYEVLLRGSTSATVRRYRAAISASGKREQIPFALTQEALAKLIGDLIAEK